MVNSAVVVFTPASTTHRSWKSTSASVPGRYVWGTNPCFQRPTRLRRDLSAVASVETAGDRATVATARGTRYALRRRANGMWGLTMFTAPLVAEAERAARDLDVVEASAVDFERGGRP